MNTKNNNISLIKFVSAILVIFSHAFPITNGPNFFDPVNRLTHGQLDLGNLSVCIFLFFSGFLITKSLISSGGGVYIF